MSAQTGGDAGERVARLVAERILGQTWGDLERDHNLIVEQGQFDPATSWKSRCLAVANEIAAALQSERTAAASQAHIPTSDAVDLAMAEAERLGSRSFPGAGDTLMISVGRLRTIIAGAASQARRETIEEAAIQVEKLITNNDPCYAEKRAASAIRALATPPESA